MALATFAEHLFELYARASNLNQMMDESSEIQHTAAFLQLFQDDLFANFLKRIKECQQWAFVEASHQDEIKNLSTTEKGLYFLAKGRDLKQKETEPGHFCKHCLKVSSSPKSLKRCSKCREVRYCDATCQRKDWILHKRFCKQG